MIHVFLNGELIQEYGDETPWMIMDVPYGSYIRFSNGHWYTSNHFMWVAPDHVPKENRTAALLLT